MKTFIKVILLLTCVLLVLTGCNPEQEQANGSNELTIATFLENRFLEYAVHKYEEMHEGVTINLDIYTQNSERDIEKYSQIIDTSLMSGGGADIIDVGYINWAALADSNKLLDLNEKIEFSPDAYYLNILDAFLYNGKRYAIPLSFSFSAFRFDDAFSEMETSKHLTLDGMLSLADKYSENPLFLSSSGFSALNMAYIMFSTDFDSYIDVQNKNANIDNEKFISMLESINSLNNLRWPEQGETALMWELLLYNPAMCSNGMEDYTDMFLLTNDKGESLFSSAGFIPSINANSPNQELAVDFMQFLLSDEMQSSSELMFNPVNRNSSAEMAALFLAEAQAEGYAAEDFNLENNIKAFNELAERLTVVEYSDSFVTQFVRDELTRYFEGEVSAEQAAKNLQSRLNTYLKE